MSAVLQTLADLVRINSVNPEWNGPGEAGVAKYVREFFLRAGVEAWEEEVLPGRNNVMARIPGKDRSHSVLLEAHMDTVSTGNMEFDPFDPVIENRRLRGRGSCDVKAGLAAMMHAVVEVREPACDVILAAVVDEEHAYRGVTRLVGSLQGGGQLPAAAVVAEPTELRAIRANKGVLRWEVVTHGKTAHSSKPELGSNAITIMARVILALEKHFDGLAQKTHPLVGKATGSIGVIEGGSQVNVVPDECRIKIDRRLLPGETAEDAHAQCREALLKELPGTEFEMLPPSMADEGMETPADAAVVKTASRVLVSMGLDGEPAGVTFGCDCTKLSRAGIPSIIFGPGSVEQAHTDDEYIEVAQVESALEFYRQFLIDFQA